MLFTHIALIKSSILAAYYTYIFRTPEWLLCLKRHWPEQRKTTHPEVWFCCIFSNPHRRILCTGFELGVVFKIMLQDTAIFLRCTMHDPWASPLKRRWKCERTVYRSISERIMAFSPSAWVLWGLWISLDFWHKFHPFAFMILFLH